MTLLAASVQFSGQHSNVISLYGNTVRVSFGRGFLGKLGLVSEGGFG